MKHCILILIFLLPFLSQAKTVKVDEIAWLPQFAEQNNREFKVCGNSNIQPTKKSLSKHFISGSQQTGFLFSNLISYPQYFAILSDKRLEEAKSALQAEFTKTHLWKYSNGKGFEDLGAPRKMDFSFSATIKDCMEGAKTTLGNDCSHLKGDGRHSCCREKFSGPTIFWGDNENYKLMYSPDPSVRLKVDGEKTHRYCNVQETIRLHK